ncbi:RNA-binding protein [Turnera subulata]|uniref:Ribonuclease III domain-containing protein RNC1, chloroplastic n=1 Tax=Turnera subulata TaxID=218843 RepID=A0A9Q0F9L4_9ROSI|nr:RNA-binding protein [Turnera subulata]
MELYTPFTHLPRVSDISFLSPFSPQLPLNLRHKTRLKPRRILAVAVDPQRLQLPDAAIDDPQEEDRLPANSPQRLLKELQERRKFTSPKKRLPPKRFILRPPLDDKKLAARFLNSPQLSLKQFPLLSSCLPSARLNNADKTWMEEYLLEAKQALGYRLEPSEGLGDDNPAKQFDTLLYLAFQHPSCERTMTRHVKSGHSRLWFLGQYVLELALAELFLQRYPRESPGPMRERVFALIGKRFMPKWIKAASLDNLVFPYDDMFKLLRKEREPPVKSVFWALFGAIYLCFGMPEPPEDALFAHPRLFRACVPPGMHRFRGNIWDYDSRPVVMKTLGYPLALTDRIPEITEARNIELGLGLQLCFLHPSKYKFEHPRFCYERLEYVGQKIQDLVMAERLLMKHLDAPGKWLQERHRRLLLNKFCGRYLREKYLHKHIIYSEKVVEGYEHNRRLRNPTTTAVQQALHGLSYTVYGKPDVRRLMFEVFDFEKLQPKAV